MTSFTGYQDLQMEEEAKRLLDLDCTMGVEKQSRKRIVSNGDVIDLPNLLFTKNRQILTNKMIHFKDLKLLFRCSSVLLEFKHIIFLLDLNKNVHCAFVRAEQLAGKVIALYFIPLFKSDHSRFKLYTTLLIDVYNNLRSSNGFEVVFVPLHDPDTSFNLETSLHHSSQKEPHSRFEQLFSCMPWTSIPFSDIASSKRLQIKFDVFSRNVSYHTMFVIDSTCIVLQCHAMNIVEKYGALGYPFCDERVKFLEAEEDAIINKPSLKTLLGSPHRDYVITNKGEKVPIHTLEDKVVALYFYEHEITEEYDTEELKMAYEELAKTEKSFEVVLIYLNDTENTTCSQESFWKEFKTMPWLALPFKDPNNKKLQHIFEYSQGFGQEIYLEPCLVIFGPHGEFIEPIGQDVLHRYKIPAYPFTRNKVAKLEAEKAQELRMEMLWDLETVFRRIDESQVTFSELSGKRVFVFFESCRFLATSECRVVKFLKMLKERYIHMRGSDDEFEVIHIIKSKMESCASIYVGDVPWLISRELPAIDFGSYFFDDAVFDIFGYCPSFAFGRDGRLVRRTIYSTFQDMDFPFYAGGLDDEALSELNTLFFWNYWDYYPNKGRIYSLKDKLTKVNLWSPHGPYLVDL